MSQNDSQEFHVRPLARPLAFLRNPFNYAVNSTRILFYSHCFLPDGVVTISQTAGGVWTWRDHHHQRITERSRIADPADETGLMSSRRPNRRWALACLDLDKLSTHQCCTRQHNCQGSNLLIKSSAKEWLECLSPVLSPLRYVVILGRCMPESTQRSSAAAVRRRVWRLQHDGESLLLYHRDPFRFAC